MTSTVDTGRRAGDASRPRFTISDQRSMSDTAHVRRLQARHQRAATPNGRPTRVRPWAGGGPRTFQQCRFARAAQVSAPADTSMNAPKPSAVASRHVTADVRPTVTSAACARSLPERRAGRGHVVPVENQRARPSPLRLARAANYFFYGFGMAITLQRRPTGARADKDAPVGHRLSSGRTRPRPRRDRRDPDRRSSSGARGVVPPIHRAAPEARAAGWARDTEIRKRHRRAVDTFGGVDSIGLF